MDDTPINLGPSTRNPLRLSYCAFTGRWKPIQTSTSAESATSIHVDFPPSVPVGDLGEFWEDFGQHYYCLDIHCCALKPVGTKCPKRVR